MQGRGVQDAENVKALKGILKGQGIFLTEAFEDSKGKAQAQDRDIDLKQLFSRVRPVDIAVLTRQLATLVKAGIPLVESLEALLDQIEKVKLRRIFAQIKEEVREGSSFADALEKHPKIFTRLYVNMIRAGEAAGSLDVVLIRLSDFMENQNKIRGKVSSAMSYPAIMTVMGTGIVIFLFIVVIPKVTTILTDLEVALPLPTQILIGLSAFLAQFWWLLLLLGGGLFFGVRKYLSTAEGRASRDRFMLKVPIFGPLGRMMAVSRFARTLATLLSSGVPLLTALDVVKNVLENVVLQGVIEQARVAIREGEDIASPLRKSGEFPPIMTHMIAIGEKSGQLESMLQNVSDAYDNQVENKVNSLTSLLEPLMIVGMGGVVVFILFSILMPILRINESIQ